VLELDGQQLVNRLTGLALERCGRPVLRTYWYDGAKDGLPTVDQQVIAALPNVKLRLGRLNARKQQKGVDALIYRDLMTLARERAISDAVLVSGDEDLREGVRTAQDMGVRVTLVGIHAVSQDYNQSRELVWEADELITLGLDDLAPSFTRRDRGDPLPMLLPAVAEQVSTSPEIAPGEDARAAARDYGERWWSKATEDERTTLNAGRPRIPPLLDAELLREVDHSIAGSLRGQDRLRREVRGAFWSRIPRFDEGEDGDGDVGDHHE
jgi:hypothetical protein